MRLLTSKQYTDEELLTQAKVFEFRDFEYKMLNFQLVYTNIVIEMDHLVKAMPAAGLNFSDPMREVSVV